MPIQATVINNYDPPVSINIHEESATQNRLSTAVSAGFCAAVSGGMLSIAGLAIAGIRNAGPWALVPCNISDTCKRLAAVTPAAVRCLTDTAILGRKLLCGGGGGSDPYAWCTWDEEDCLWRQRNASEDMSAERAGLGIAAAAGLGLGIGFAALAIKDFLYARSNAQQQPRLVTVEITQTDVNAQAREINPNPSVTVVSSEAQTAAATGAVLIMQPDDSIQLGSVCAQENRHA